MITKKSILLIDGTYYLYRAYYALPLFTNTLGEPIGAIYGIINMIKKILHDHKPKYMIIIFDSPSKNFRHQLFPEYKKNRKNIPDELKIQINSIYKIIKYLGVSTIIIPNFEADDVIGTLSNYYAQKNNLVLISTNDKDLGQLVSNNIKIINNDNKILGPKEIELKYGVQSQFIPDLLGLMGDTTDNIPGIPGIGKKTAIKLIQNFGSIDNIYKNSNLISSLPIRNAKNIAIKIITHRNIAFLSYMLSKIKTDVPINFNTIQLQIKPPYISKLLKIFEHHGLEKWKKNINNLINFNITNQIEYNNTNNHINNKQITNCNITSIEILIKWIKKLDTLSIFSFYLHLEDINFNRNIIGIGIAINSQESMYINFCNYDKKDTSKLNHKNVFSYLKYILEDPKKIKIGYNFKNYYYALKKYNINLNGAKFDVILESYIINQSENFYNLCTKAKLENIFLEYINKNTEKNKQLSADQLNLGLQAYIILQLHNIMWNKIKKDSTTSHIFHTIDIPLIKILAKIEYYGVLIDKEKLHIQSNLIKHKLLKLISQAHQLAGEPFNLCSNKQIKNILYFKNQLNISMKTKTGNKSTNKLTLNKLSLLHPLPKIILEYRSLYKLQSTYLNKLPKMINSYTGRIHSSYYQTSTITGRLSSRNPNLQNIPIKQKIGKKIRRAFIPEKNFFILSLDYSQIELRILAHFSQDPKLTQYFTNNQDVHILTATEIFNIPYNEVTIEQRNHAKSINFAVIYGISAFGLAEQLKINYKDAKKYIHTYFNQHKGIVNYINETKKHVKKLGYVSTITGRKIYIPNINSTTKYIQESSERTAINGSIQGTASDIIKLAMINIENWLNKFYPIDVKMIMQVHDELIFEVHHQYINIIKEKIKYLMENSILLNVPIKVNAKIGINWNEIY